MLDEFISYLRHERNYSELTVAYYEAENRAFQQFFQSKDEQLDWLSVDKDVVRAWMEHCIDCGDAPGTVNKKLSALRAFFRYQMKKGLRKTNPMLSVRGPKRGKVLPVFVRENELDRLIDAEPSAEDSYQDSLARTIIILLYETGMRLAELIGLVDDDIDYVNCRIKVTGKRDKQRIIPFGKELGERLREYQQLRDATFPEHEPALLINNRGKRVSRTLVSNMVRGQLALVTSLKKKSPHVLRHSFATAMLNNGARIESVQKLLGHQSIETTQVYVHTTFEQLRKEYEKSHPRG